jgi:hypothetical protein
MIIIFSKKFYNLNSIKNTIKAYKDLAVFNLKNNRFQIKVEAKKIDKDVESIFKDEFCNYALAEMKKF